MSGTISISGLGSGLSIDSWISALVSIRQADITKLSTQKSTLASDNSTLSSVKTDFSSLLSSMQTLTDSLFGGTKDIFGQKTATSSSTSVASASATASAAKQNVALSVTTLATASKAQSATAAAKAIDANTKISDISGGAIDAGKFSVYVNNQKYTVDVASSSTLGSVLSSIASATGNKVTASVTNGKITIAAVGSSDTVAIGSSSDTSDFASVLGFAKDTGASTSSYTSGKTIWQTSTSAALTGSSANFASAITAGTFTIGNAQFTVDGTTTMDGLISQINSSTDAGVTAYWDGNLGKLVLKSAHEGATNINIEAGTSNFTDVMGLTSSTWDTNGSLLTTKLTDNSQTLGDNAVFSVNGNPITSTSNTITSDISGISGLTLTLSGTGSSTVAVTSDTTKMTSALTAFVTAFNKVISDVDSATTTGGDLYGESTLTSIRNSLRIGATSSLDATSTNAYKLLSSIGITTGSVGAAVSDNTNKLTLDSTALSDALSNNPDAVKKLLIGDGTTDGILTKLSSTVSYSLDSTNGYFATRTDTYNKQISDLADKIKNQTSALSDYKKSLETKFNAMDTAIAKMKSQMSYVASALGLTTSSSSSSSSSG